MIYQSFKSNVHSLPTDLNREAINGWRLVSICPDIMIQPSPMQTWMQAIPSHCPPNEFIPVPQPSELSSQVILASVLVVMEKP
jgi:hypothetical protein